MIETVPSGTVLNGRYRIERVLGSGGFGHVYLAMDQTTNQQYAVKEYLVSGASGKEQLKHEATVLSQLHHPNLPAFQDAFMERGRYYIVLNYIEGNDLTDLLRTARLRNEVVPIAKITSWLLGICDAVLFLHSQQPPVIHRDIKPDNIRITSTGTAVLVDLGNAKAAADGARTLFFIRHQGTPGYAPQEQYPGGSGTDIRSDVYALGGTLYFALVAQEPPSVSTRNQHIQQGRSDLLTLHEILANNPPEESPEAQAARQFRLGVTKPAKPAPRHSRHVAQLGMLPPEALKQLNRVIQRAMAMRPQDRYQSVADFATDLRKVVVAMPSPPPSRSERPLDLHGTQPDWPPLSEVVEAAKNQLKGADVPTPPVPDAGSQPATGANTCPRCSRPLLLPASFCPHCGSSLNQAPPRNNTTAKANVKGNDILAEQTLLIDRDVLRKKVAQSAQNVQMVESSKQNQMPPANKRLASAPVARQQAQASGSPASRIATATQVPPVQLAPVSPPAGHTNTSPPQVPPAMRTTSSVFKLDPKLLAIILVAFVILLALILLLLLNHGGTGQAYTPITLPTAIRYQR